MTAMLILVLAGLAAILLRVATGRENPLTPHIPRGDPEHELTLKEVRDGFAQFAAVTWAVYRAFDYDHLALEPKPDAKALREGAFGL